VNELLHAAEALRCAPHSQRQATMAELYDNPDHLPHPYPYPQQAAVERVWLGAPVEQSLAVVRLARGDIKEVQDYFFGYVAVVASGSGLLVGEVLSVRAVKSMMRRMQCPLSSRFSKIFENFRRAAIGPSDRAPSPHCRRRRNVRRLEDGSRRWQGETADKHRR
jgi:hypothetical protein